MIVKSTKSPDFGLDVAFQPIANIHTGQCVGFEVLARPRPDSTAAELQALFDQAAAAGRLAALEAAVRHRAAEQARLLPPMRHRLLFFNLDHRLVQDSAGILEMTAEVVGDSADQLVTEICGCGPPIERAADWIRLLHSRDMRVALDRFGTTGESLPLLQNCDLDFLKIDRSFISGIDQIARKRVLLAQMVATAHTLGIDVIAVGVETARELQVCRSLGCDLVQGFFLQPPVLDPGEAAVHFPQVEELARQDRSRRQIDHKWIADQLDPTLPVLVDTPMTEVFARVAANPSQTLIPVVDHYGRPLGVLRERNLRNYAYSAFGKDLIANRSLGRTLQSFLVRCPIAEITTPLDQLLALYSTDEDADGILVAEQMSYRGFLSARSLIRAMHEKTLARARDENPLTKLPGNALIDDYVSGLLGRGEAGVLAYIDFDNFKPFNDTYGFRQGDRAILLFAELMRKMHRPATWFLGHIGGDDFFIGLAGTSIDEAQTLIGALIAKFTSDAESFYDPETRARGYILAADREGQQKRFPLLSASAVLIEVTAGCDWCSIDDISAAIASAKKPAKASPNKLAVAALRGPECGRGELAGELKPSTAAEPLEG